MEGADSEETMKLGMRLRNSIFVLGACVALSGYVTACGDDTDSGGSTDDAGAGKGGSSSGGKGGSAAGGKGGSAAGGKGGSGNDSDGGAEDAGK
jgi:hypothetical protein